MKSTLHEDQCTYFIIYFSFILRMRNVSDKLSAENQNIYFVFSKVFFFFEIRAAYEIMRKNTVERSRPQKTIWRMRIACWVSKATYS
jgi:hypothetical protein